MKKDIETRKKKNLQLRSESLKLLAGRELIVIAGGRPPEASYPWHCVSDDC